nr:MAG TPA: hypothetical protein [Caudoviricetes sp.]
MQTNKILNLLIYNIQNRFLQKYTIFLIYILPLHLN